MPRWIALTLVFVGGLAHAAPRIRCDNLATGELAIDGLLDEWKPSPVAARAGGAPDAVVALRCSWDGQALALALAIQDDRVVRVRGRGHQDHVTVTVAAGRRPVAVTVYPGNAIARSKLVAPRGVAVADSLQPAGFSIELRVPAARIPGLSGSTPSLALGVVFHDADRATGGADHDVAIAGALELPDRAHLLDDFLAAVRLRPADVRLDTLAELDPDRRGRERLVAGGTVIGVLTDRYAYVTLPAASPADVRAVQLLPLGPHGQQVIAAVVTQHGGGGSRDLLMLWTVWTGQLQPLGQIEVREQLGANVLASTWKVERTRRGAALVVRPGPAAGWTAQTWHEQPADDADPILVPWDPHTGGTAYALHGAELERADLPPARKRHR